MRRILPTLLCVAASTGLAACDQEPVSGPNNDDEQALFDAPRAAPAAGGALADGDTTLSRPAGGGGGDIIVFDIVGVASRTAAGTTIQVLSDTTIASPGGEVVCTKTTAGPFTQLRDADGDVLFSSLGLFVFDGQPSLNGKNPFQQFQELSSHLRFSFSFDTVVEGFANSGTEMVYASTPVQFSSGWRKLVIASLVDGYCGSDGLPD